LYALLFAIILSSCNSNFCSNNILLEVVSPNSKYVASIFERDCGATTPYVQVVSLRFIGRKFDPKKTGDWVFTIHGKSDVKIYWDGDTKLKILFSATGDSPTQHTKWQDVTISYN